MQYHQLPTSVHTSNHHKPPTKKTLWSIIFLPRTLDSHLPPLPRRRKISFPPCSRKTVINSSPTIVNAAMSYEFIHSVAAVSRRGSAGIRFTDAQRRYLIYSTGSAWPKQRFALGPLFFSCSMHVTIPCAPAPFVSFFAGFLFAGPPRNQRPFVPLKHWSRVENRTGLGRRGTHRRFRW